MLNHALFTYWLKKYSITINDNLFYKNNEEKSYSHSGYSIYVINNMLDKYTYDCIKPFCHTCGRAYIFYFNIKKLNYSILYTHNEIITAC